MKENYRHPLSPHGKMGVQVTDTYQHTTTKYRVEGIGGRG